MLHCHRGKGGGGVQSVLSARFLWSSAVFCYYTVGEGR